MKYNIHARITKVLSVGFNFDVFFFFCFFFFFFVGGGGGGGEGNQTNSTISGPSTDGPPVKRY